MEKTQTVVTLEAMKDFNSVMEAIQWAESQYKNEYKSAPSKPILSNNATSEEARKYADLLEVYEKETIDHKETIRLYYEKMNKIQSVIVEYIKDYTGLNTIPKQYRDKVYSKAYEDGHSGGFYEVYLKLESLLEIFD
jgi:DNA-binding ferritin-like protein (Dps family)